MLGLRRVLVSSSLVCEGVRWSDVDAQLRARFALRTHEGHCRHGSGLMSHPSRRRMSSAGDDLSILHRGPRGVILPFDVLRAYVLNPLHPDKVDSDGRLK